MRTKDSSKGSLHNNVGISRKRIKGLQNSHSSKRLPTWKATMSSNGDIGVNSPIDTVNLSVDRGSVCGAFGVNTNTGSVSIM